MVFLGWNEFMTILRNPLYMVLFVLCVSFAYVIFALNLWGPLERIISTVAGEATKMARERIQTTSELARDQMNPKEKKDQ